MRTTLPWKRGVKFSALATALVVAGGLVVGQNAAVSAVELVNSSVRGSDGRTYTVTNHLLPGATAMQSQAKEWLLVWAGDYNAADLSLTGIPSSLNLNDPALLDPTVGPDFLAVVDADRHSPTYGKVVNTVTVGPLVVNEPHHMQYVYHKGNRIFAGGLFTDVTYVFDASQLPALSLVGINLPTDTLCGSVPDAYWVLKDGTAYGTYMGGPDLPGPCIYTNGQIRIGNGFGGSPGELVRLSSTGRTLAEIPASRPTAEGTASNPCLNIPLTLPATCANPHGIQAREDLTHMVTSDFAEPRNIVLDPVKPPAEVFRGTVRTWDISNRNNPTLKSVSLMPDGPRTERIRVHEENRGGMMETTVTNLPNHRGAFVSSMCSGVVYYTPDMTSPNPVWREVFDRAAATNLIDPNLGTSGSGCDAGGWVQTSPDDTLLFNVAMGRTPGTEGPGDPGTPGMVYTLDIRALLAAGTGTTCSIDTITEVVDGGAEPDCPTVASVQEIEDLTSGGPHWGAMDNFARVPGQDRFTETDQVRRIATSNYFVARTGQDGDHKICMFNVDQQGKLSLDTDFRDENLGTACVSFNRTSWPHGNFGNAKPHSELFVVADAYLE
jgi:hypothetical protein